MMAITEQEILDSIKEVALEQTNARMQIAFHKKAAVDAESDLINANLRSERLIEQLRVCRVTTVSYEKTEDQKIIDAFRLRLPELLKKI